MNVVYSPQYAINIGIHVFPTHKYRLLYDRIRALQPDVEYLEPRPASWEDLAVVHTPEYLNKIRTGDLDTLELAQLELPWSPEVVEGFRLMTGGTILAARVALTGPGLIADAKSPESDPVSFHIGGGFHHAFANHGEGFCLFNDVAVATRLALQNQTVERVAIIDLDVHQGNGTAFIFERDPRVFTCSMHHQYNYPAYKPPGSLDIGLPDGADDTLYLERLVPALDRVLAHDPQVVFYLAGADPYDDDQLGGLALSKAGLRARDRMVLGACGRRHIPTVVVLAGGYARNIEDTVDIHYATFEEADNR